MIDNFLNFLIEYAKTTRKNTGVYLEKFFHAVLKKCTISFKKLQKRTVLIKYSFIKNYSVLKIKFRMHFKMLEKLFQLFYLK